MATSSKDIETLWGSFPEEGAKKGLSVAEFFESNGVPYRSFEKWYKRKFQQSDIVDCRVVDSDSTGQVSETKKSAPSDSSRSRPISYISITLSNGVKVEHRKLSYPDLLCFISKLEGLCSI